MFGEELRCLLEHVVCDLCPLKLLEHRRSMLVLVHLEQAALRDPGHASLVVEMSTVKMG